MKSYPFLIKQDVPGERLKPIEGKERGYNESWLQDLLLKQPDILPVAEIEPIFSLMIPIGREVSVKGGFIDCLFISPSGYLIMVETKLWRNPEAKREVVAQVFEYGSSLSKWTYDKLNDATKEYTKKYSGAELNLVDWVEQQSGPSEAGKDYFEETVRKNLRLGRFLALIVGDRIWSSVVEMLDYVATKYPGLARDVALIELQAYRLEEGHIWPLLIVPKIVTRTKIIERSIVQVTLVEGKPPDIIVQQEKVKLVDIEKKRVPLTEEAFWELLQENAPNQYQVSRDLIKDEFEKVDGIEILPRESSIVIALSLPETGQLVSLFFLTTSAYLSVWPQGIARKLSSAGFDETLARDYDEQMRQILKMPKNRADLSAPIASINIIEFKKTVHYLIKKIKIEENEQ